MAAWLGRIFLEHVPDRRGHILEGHLLAEPTIKKRGSNQGKLSCAVCSAIDRTNKKTAAES